MEAPLRVLEEIASGWKTAVERIDADMRAMRSEQRADFRWLMGTMLATCGAILAVVAHGFHWIP